MSVPPESLLLFPLASAVQRPKPQESRADGSLRPARFNRPEVGRRTTMPRRRLIYRRDPEEEGLAERPCYEIDTDRQTRRHRPDQPRAAAAVGHAVPYRRRQAGRDRDCREALLPDERPA